MPQAVKKITTDHGQPQTVKVEKSSYPEKGHHFFRNKLTFEHIFLVYHYFLVLPNIISLC